MKRLAVFFAIIILLLWASLALAEEYRVIRKISVPKRASHLTISPDVSKVAYKAKIRGKEFVMINDKKVLPEFDSVTFAQERFKKTGEHIFAGYDQEKHEILHAISLVKGK